MRKMQSTFLSPFVGGANTNRESHSTIRDNDLDLLVRGILQVTPRIGYRLVQEYLYFSCKHPDGEKDIGISAESAMFVVNFRFLTSSVF